MKRHGFYAALFAASTLLPGCSYKFAPDESVLGVNPSESVSVEKPSERVPTPEEQSMIEEAWELLKSLKPKKAPEPTPETVEFLSGRGSEQSPSPQQ